MSIINTLWRVDLASTPHHKKRVCAGAHKTNARKSQYDSTTQAKEANLSADESNTTPHHTTHRPRRTNGDDILVGGGGWADILVPQH